MIKPDTPQPVTSSLDWRKIESALIFLLRDYFAPPREEGGMH